ncbi:MAG: hypothetical protein D6679_10585 [Candidatus Hydrogenedentota bacterium]|nr:MAG: hypothetical protein D6679_10585 [Candidatus Hydrogenedentota bacterium]
MKRKGFRFSVVIGSALLMAGAVFFFARPGVEAKGRSGGHEGVVLRGELIDLGCYLDHGARGKKHQACAVTCAKAGGPLGVLNESDETIYIVTGDHGKLLEGLADLAGQEVEVRGKVMVRHGIAAVYPFEIHAKKSEGAASQPY